MTTFTCDFSAEGEAFPHFWEHTVGSGHAELALRADWQLQMRRCHDELGFRHVRFHGLLSAPMDAAICQDNRMLYSFFNIDQIFDFLLSIGMKPFVELSFMPPTLSSGGTTVFHYEANVTPPREYSQWSVLMEKLARHLVERYGIEEVRQWFFEVWNEPNMSGFWTGTQADYFELYRATVTALKEVDSQLRVGGPASAQNAWIVPFLDFCDTAQLPVDFVSTHHYPTDAFGKPGDDTVTQLSKSKRGILRKQAQTAKQEAKGKPLYYTEWNSSSNPRDPLHDQPYAAAFDAKTILDNHGLVEGYSFWTFTDIFQENYMPSQPFQGGFGLLSLHGIAKPAYRAFQLLHRLGDELLPVSGTNATVDAWAVRDDSGVTFFLTNHALPRHEIATETVKLHLKNAPEIQAVFIERIDDEHANARATWQQMGEPEYLSEREKQQLFAASELMPESLDWKHENNALECRFKIPPHGIAAVHVRWKSDDASRSAGAPCT